MFLSYVASQLRLKFQKQTLLNFIARIEIVFDEQTTMMTR
jgi:hypothetical protein